MTRSLRKLILIHISMVTLVFTIVATGAAQAVDSDSTEVGLNVTRSTETPTATATETATPTETATATATATETATAIPTQVAGSDCDDESGDSGVGTNTFAASARLQSGDDPCDEEPTRTPGKVAVSVNGLPKTGAGTGNMSFAESTLLVATGVFLIGATGALLKDRP